MMKFFLIEWLTKKTSHILFVLTHSLYELYYMIKFSIVVNVISAAMNNFAFF